MLVEQDINTRKLMSQAKFFEGYSRWDDDKNKYEDWESAVSRVMEMHREKYKDIINPELEQYINEAENLYKLKYALGAQRALQFGGEQLLKQELRLYNCLSSYADRPEFFGEVFFSLLCGCGTGFSVQKHHIHKLPKIQNRTKQAKIHIVEDSIEGWAESLDVLMSSFFVGGGKHPDFEKRRIYFDLSQIRPKGAFISGGFKAPGPEPLRQALDKIEHMLQGIVLKGSNTLTPIEVYDIVMHTANAVLAGGVRRCLPEWYEVKTTDGWKTIKDVKIGDYVDLPEGEFRVENNFNQGIQKTVKFVTKEGSHISTKKHKWLVYDKKEKVAKWITAKDFEKDRYAFLKPKNK